MKPAALARLAVVIIIRKDSNPEESDRTPEAQVREAVKLLLFKCRGCGMDVDPDFRTGVVRPVNLLRRGCPWMDVLRGLSPTNER